jgi:hypothetical protein
VRERFGSCVLERCSSEARSSSAPLTVIEGISFVDLRSPISFSGWLASARPTPRWDGGEPVVARLLSLELSTVAPSRVVACPRCSQRIDRTRDLELPTTPAPFGRPVVRWEHWRTERPNPAGPFLTRTVATLECSSDPSAVRLVVPAGVLARLEPLQASTDTVEVSFIRRNRVAARSPDGLVVFDVETGLTTSTEW